MTREGQALATCQGPDAWRTLCGSHSVTEPLLSARPQLGLGEPAHPGCPSQRLRDGNDHRSRADLGSHCHRCAGEFCRRNRCMVSCWLAPSVPGRPRCRCARVKAKALPVVSARSGPRQALSAGERSGARHQHDRGAQHSGRAREARTPGARSDPGHSLRIFLQGAGCRWRNDIPPTPLLGVVRHPTKDERSSLSKDSIK